MNEEQLFQYLKDNLQIRLSEKTVFGPTHYIKVELVLRENFVDKRSGFHSFEDVVISSDSVQIDRGI